MYTITYTCIYAHAYLDIDMHVSAYTYNIAFVRPATFSAAPGLGVKWVLYPSKGAAASSLLQARQEEDLAKPGWGP